MRMWHKDLIPLLPRQQLLGQWRECCLIARQIAEKGTPNHVLVNMVTGYPAEHLNEYACLVIREMERRGYHVDISRFASYRVGTSAHFVERTPLFPGWHNDRYLKQCLANLQEKADAGAISAEEWKRITDVYPEWR